MKTFKIILVIIIISLLSFGGYYGYQYYKQWEERKFNEIEFLKRNQDMMVQKITDLSVTVTKVVNDTVKVQTVTKEDATYEELKKKIIELQKDEKANKEQIAKLREDLSIQRKAFLASDDTILISGKNDETYLLYRDESGNLQPASDNIEKIIEHKELSSNVPILAEEEIAVKKTSLKLKAGGYYNITGKESGIILSKGLFGIKNYSLNVSLLSDLKDLEGINLGANINYGIKDNLELGIGITIDKDYFIVLEYSF